MIGLKLRSRNAVVVAAFVTVAAATAAAVAFVPSSDAGTQVKTRTIYMSAVEWKGSASVAKEPYPTQPLPAGGGYESFPPGSPEVNGDPGKWAVETYRFDTAVVAACKGEKVVLKMFGVNAASHQIVIPDFKKRVTIYRGRLATTSMIAKEVGIFPIICATHMPAHRADLVVLPC